MPGMQVHGLLLKTDKGNITVQLGPPAYVRKQGFDLKQGDSLEVTGSQVTRDGRAPASCCPSEKRRADLEIA